MVSQEEIRHLNQSIEVYQEAVAELQELYESSQKTGVTVDQSAYADAQERAKDAIAQLANDANTAVSDSAIFTPRREGGTQPPDVDLPNPALSGNGDTAPLPDPPATRPRP